MEKRPDGRIEPLPVTEILKTRQERHEELKRISAQSNGLDRLYSILTRNFIAFKKLPIGTLMIEAILDHEYPAAC